MRQIATADVGGTHARFATATVDDGHVIELGEPVTVKTSEFASFQHAWQEFGRRIDQPLPQELAIAFAGPVGGDVLKLTNNPWVIRPALMQEKLGVDQYVIVNDFAAIAHAVAELHGSAYRHVCGPERNLPETGVISIVGPGTGLGVASLLKRADGYDVIATEGGHVDWAPLDPLEDRILVHLRENFRRVSVERLVSGRGLHNIYEALGTIENRPYTLRDEKDLWAAALDGSDTLAAAALDRFCLIFGAAAGDFALAQGAQAVVLAGGLGLRLVDYLPRSGFRDRFLAKGRFERMMSDMPVKVIVHPQPGLFGAAAAFASSHRGL
jgi:glucokinase